MGIETLLAIVGTAVALAALFGVFVAKYRTSKDDETLSIWRGEAEAWKEKATRLEQTLTAQQKSIDLLTDRINKVEHENELLRELVTGEKAIKELQAEITAGFAAMEMLIKERVSHGARSVEVEQGIARIENLILKQVTEGTAKMDSDLARLESRFESLLRDHKRLREDMEHE